jgi:hypothetical protein
MEITGMETRTGEGWQLDQEREERETDGKEFGQLYGVLETSRHLPDEVSGSYSEKLERTQHVFHDFEGFTDSKVSEECRKTVGILYSESDTRQLYQLPDRTESQDDRQLFSESPDTRKLYTSQTNSPDTKQLYSVQTESSDTRQVYPSQTESPDTCQTSQVSSSVSERLLYRQPGKTDSQESNWDINDPDIPARIEQHVSSCLGYLY